MKHRGTCIGFAEEPSSLTLTTSGMQTKPLYLADVRLTSRRAVRYESLRENIFSEVRTLIHEKWGPKKTKLLFVKSDMVSDLFQLYHK